MEEINIFYLNTNTKIIKFDSESNKRFNKRLTFIKILENHKIDWKNAQKLSKIWYNIKFNSSKYPVELYKSIMFYDNILESRKT
jgi:hypothetical protein